MMKKTTLINGLIAISIIILALFKNASYSSDSKSNQIEEVKEETETKKDEDSKDVELSKEEAYKELASYNKIYNWMYMFVKDENYEPAKKYEYKNPELRIAPNAIKLNSDIYDIIDYKVVKGYFKDQLVSVTFTFSIPNGKATFFHDFNPESRSPSVQENREYYFELIDNTSSISIYCANRAPIQFYF